MVTSTLANQKKKELPARRQFESVLPYVSGARTKKEKDKILSAAREERLWDLVTQPEVIGFAMTIGGIYASQKIRFVPKTPEGSDIPNEGIQAIATMTSVLLGLGHAGVGDITTATIAGLAGVASAIEGVTEVVEDVTHFEWNPLKWKWPLGPIWNQ